MLTDLHAKTLITGALVGIAEIVECHPFTEEMADEMRRALAYFGDWTSKLFAWELANPRRLQSPIYYPGKLGLFRVESLTVKE